jgi:hypothetical protein
MLPILRQARTHAVKLQVIITCITIKSDKELYAAIFKYRVVKLAVFGFKACSVT